MRCNTEGGLNAAGSVLMTRVAEMIFLSCYAAAGAALIRRGVNGIRDLFGDVDTASIRRHGTQ